MQQAENYLKQICIDIIQLVFPRTFAFVVVVGHQVQSFEDGKTAEDFMEHGSCSGVFASLEVNPVESDAKVDEDEKFLLLHAGSHELAVVENSVLVIDCDFWFFEIGFHKILGRDQDVNIRGVEVHFVYLLHHRLLIKPSL